MINFRGYLPHELAIPKHASSSPAILRKHIIETIPTEQSTFAPNGNQIITFNVASNDSVLYGRDCYFRCDLQRTEGATYNQKATLDEGGVNALFRSIEVRAIATGNLIQRYDHYNRYNAMKTNIHNTPVEASMAFNNYGDDVGTGDYSFFEGNRFQASATAASITVSTGGALVLGVGGRAHSEMAPGDHVWVQGVDGAGGDSSFLAEVVSITDDENVVLSNGPAAAIVSNAISKVFVTRKNAHTNARSMAIYASGANVTVLWKPQMSFLNNNIPLWLTNGGFEFRFELETGDRAINSGFDVEDASTAIQYQITTPRFMAMHVTPADAVKQEYNRQFQTNDGLVYYIPSVRTRRLTRGSTDTNDNIQTNVGVRSGKKVYAIVQDSVIAEGSSNLTRSSNSLSEYARDNITSYQFRIGTYEFPQRNVVCDDESWEAYQHLKMVSGNYSGFRFSTAEWASPYNAPKKIAANTVVQDSSKFIMCADLARDQGFNSGLTGADLHMAPLDLEIERSNTHASLNYTGNPVVFIFVEYDAYLKISSQQISLMA